MRIRLFLVLALATLLGLVLRMHDVGVRGMWLDEIHTYDACNVPATPRELASTWWSSYKFSVMDPPLYYALSFLTAHGETTYDQARLRSVSVIAGTASIPACYLLLSALAGSLIGVVGALLLAVNTFAIQYSQEHRPYALFLFFSLVFCHAAVLCARKISWRNWLYMTISALSLIYTHYFGGIVVIATMPVWLVASGLQQDGKGKRVALALLVMCAVLTLAYIPVMRQWPEMVAYNSPGFGKDTQSTRVEQMLYEAASSRSYIKDLLTTLPAWRSGDIPSNAVWFSWVLGLVGIVSLAIRRRRLFVTLLVWTLLGWIMTLCFYRGFRISYDARRSIYLLPLFVLLLAEGILAPQRVAVWRGRGTRSVRLASVLSAILLALVLFVYMSGFREYANVGYRNETKQADWEGAVKRLTEFARRGDELEILPLPDTWLGSHIKYYKRHYCPALPVRHLAQPAELAQADSDGVPLWTFIDSPTRHKTEMVQYLAKEGVWIPMFGGALIFLPPTLTPSRPENLRLDLLVRETGEYALVFPREVNACVQFDGETSWSIRLKWFRYFPPREMEAGVHRIEILPESADKVATPTLYRRIKEGEWQSALLFDLMTPSSSALDFPLYEGQPYLSMMHNGSLQYSVFVDQAGEYDLWMDARHDKPGPITVRVFDIKGTDLGKFRFDKANNRFEPRAIRVALKAGPNRFTFYYNSFDRTKTKQANPEDEYNSFDFLRWRLALPPVAVVKATR